MVDVVLAFDVGGTKTAAALVDAEHTILDSVVAPTPAADGPEAVIATMVDLASTLLGRTRRARIRAVGVGTAGVVDVPRGTIISATDTFAGWPGTPVARRVADELVRIGVGAVPVHVQNDVDACALGEAKYGAARGTSDVIVVAVGTGVGAGVIVDGRVIRGARHVAGEIGHLPIAGAAHLCCPCGRPGHLEALGSGTGMHRHYLSLGGDPAVEDARGIVVRAAGGDATAGRALDESAASVGRALAGIATLLDPGCIVVTGGVAGIGDAWWRPMERAFRDELIDVLAELPLRRGELGGDAQLYGAAAAAWERVEAES
ncbi:ROK family protein [Agromyces sp. SYSU K20354]|uniref:ROK family protein n=1 Tax=Agromyces cavernae TaxID=2898659 RepID=UPI001E35DF2B|nr:ROK family protein [Agromyces cavernae]MCD2441248.1 ROK family protein [Agromyces cavernae]